jgi:acetoin utilization deacetylase AcuC-like enzyme
MTLLVTHPACLAHDMGEGHPERPDRLRAIDRALESETFQTLARDVAPRADIAAIAREHPLEYIERRGCRLARSRPRFDPPAAPFSPSTKS